MLNSSLAHTRSQQAPCLHLPRELLWRSTRVMAGKTVSSAAKSQDAGPCGRKCSLKRCPPDQTNGSAVGKRLTVREFESHPLRQTIYFYYQLVGRSLFFAYLWCTLRLARRKQNRS